MDTTERVNAAIKSTWEGSVPKPGQETIAVLRAIVTPGENDEMWRWQEQDYSERGLAGRAFDSGWGCAMALINAILSNIDKNSV